MGYPLAVDGDKAWQTTTADRCDGGINLLERPDQIKLEEFLQCKNVILKKGKVYQDTGYAPFAGVVAGIPQLTEQFFKKSGASELLLVTTVTLYKFATGPQEWQYIKGDASTTLSAQANAGATSLQVVSSAGFTAGLRLGVILDNGAQHQTTVNGAPPDGTHINITAAIPVGRNAPNGAAVVLAVALTGNLDNPVVSDTLPSHDWFVFTNNVNPPKRYDGTDCVVIPNLPSAGNTVCKALRLYNNALFLLNTIEGGTAFPQRVRRSDATDPTNWTTGTAGYDDLYDSSDFVMCGETLGPYIIVYRERNIARGEFIGQGGINYNFDNMIKGEGVLSPIAVVDMGDFHLFVGNANIYEYRGGFDYEPIGDKMYYSLFGSESDVNPSKRHRAFAFYVEELDEAWMFFPSNASDFCDRLIRYNAGGESFVERRFAHTFCGYGFFQRQESFAWSDLVGAWQDQVWQWNSRAVQADSPTTHLCAAEVGQVYEYDYTTTDDAGAVIDFTLETRDFILPGGMLRHDTFEGYLRGNDILVEYSVDEGVTWDTIGSVTNTSHNNFHMQRQVVAGRIRFRITGADPQFMLSFYQFIWKLESMGR